MKTITTKQISEHELLDHTDRQVADAMRRDARETKREFTMLDFAVVKLKGEARNYVESDEYGETDWPAQHAHRLVTRERALKRAAIFYVYEALRAVDAPIINEWPEFDEMLRCLVTLDQELP